LQQEQFPLVQRQWEAVSQFRSQIIHKATISLREYTVTVEVLLLRRGLYIHLNFLQSTCATLLTLYLLDSRPLSDTLSVLLGQRSKYLLNTLSWKYDENSSSSTNNKPNGHALPACDPFSDLRRKPVEDVKTVIHTALDSISRTVKATRSIYEDDGGPSLIRRVLEYIQSSSIPPEQSQQLPSELCLTTQILLTTLPSSTHFLLLPPNLRTYKPYVDLYSSSSSIPQSYLTQKVDEWFRQSSSSLHIAVEQWFLNLRSVKEIWSVRSSTKKRISNSGLVQEEASHLMNILDESCRTCIVRIWKLKLDSTLKCFEDCLNSTVSSLNDPSKSRQMRMWSFLLPRVCSDSQCLQILHR
jgi:conserved oligomeric Golgi complex subunit 1